MRTLFSRYVTRSILLAGCFLLCMARAADAAEPAAKLAPPSELATTALVKGAQELLESRKLEQAVPYLEEVIARFKDLPGKDAEATRTVSMMQLGMCYLEIERYEEAAALYESFVEQHPDHESALKARFLALEAYAWMDDPARMKAYIEQLEASGGLAEIFAVLQGEEADASRHALISLVSAYARAADLKNMERFLPYCDEAARCDVGLNLALIEGGDLAFENGEFLTALYLYRKVKMLEDVRADYDRRLAALKLELEQPLPWVPLTQRDAQQTARAREQARYERMVSDRETLAERSYDLDVQIRMAQCFDSLTRHWQAYEIYTHIHSAFPDSRQAEQCRYGAFQSLVSLEEFVAARDEGYVYTGLYPQGRFVDEVSLSLMHMHLALQEMEKADGLGRELLQKTPVHRYLDQVNYLLGYIQFQWQNYEAAMAFFKETSEKWPNRLYAEESVYWVGMCHLFLSEFDQAIAVFDGYLNNPAWPKKEFAEDVTYRLGMARYGLGDFAASEETFLAFTKQFPDSQLFSEACSMLGDLRGAEGDLDTSLVYYGRARETAVNGEQRDYAVFQTARIYELQKRYEDTIAFMGKYLEEYGEQGNLAEASLWTARSWEALGDEGKALDICCDTILRYGNNPGLESIGLLLDQLIQKAADDETGGYAARVKEKLGAQQQASCSDASSKTLCLRLSALLEEISTGAEREAYADVLLAETDLAPFAPLPLVVRVGEAAARGQADRAQQAYDYFVEHFDSSDRAPDMANVQIVALMNAEKYEEALALADKTLERFAGYQEAGLTQKLSGDVLRRMGEYERAIEKYNTFVGIREWRGELTPQAVYWIGVCLREQGKIEEAFAYFQRVYVLYELYPEWTSKAYEASVDCLRRLGREEDAVQTLREMVANRDILATPEGRRAQEELSKLDGGAK